MNIPMGCLTPWVTRQPVWLFDMDGTLSDPSWRDPYDASRSTEDPVNIAVMQIAMNVGNIVIVTGRQEVHHEALVRWLCWHGIYDKVLRIYMRPKGSPVKDWQLKEYFLHAKILPQFTVLGVFDDRQSVVDMWRRNGLTCFQVDNRVA